MTLESACLNNLLVHLKVYCVNWMDVDMLLVANIIVVYIVKELWGIDNVDILL